MSNPAPKDRVQIRGFDIAAYAIIFGVLWVGEHFGASFPIFDQTTALSFVPKLAGDSVCLVEIGLGSEVAKHVITSANLVLWASFMFLLLGLTRFREDKIAMLSSLAGDKTRGNVYNFARQLGWGLGTFSVGGLLWKLTFHWSTCFQPGSSLSEWRILHMISSGYLFAGLLSLLVGFCLGAIPVWIANRRTRG